MKLSNDLITKSAICIVLTIITAVNFYAMHPFIWDVKLILEIISCAGATVTALGVLFAYSQLRLTHDISISQFESQLFLEYRRVIEKIPSSVMLGEDVTDYELTEMADDFYMYVDLTNEQIHLRMSNKITKETWSIWRDGIRSNLLLPAFKKSWDRIKKSTSSFQELRRFENEGFMSDPICWGRD